MPTELVQLGTLITAIQAAQRLGVCPQTLARWRQAGNSPRWVRLSSGPRGRVMYTPEALAEWIASHSATSTSQETADRQQATK